MDALGRNDLAPILARHSGNAVFTDALNAIKSPEELLRLFGLYVAFNAPFGGGVANLAGEIAVRQGLFRDLSDPIEANRDRSVVVAADVFFAAIDEFGDRVALATHRTLAQATLKGVMQYFGYDPPRLNGLLQVNRATESAIHKVQNGYAVNRSVDECQLFSALGFHMGSEILADEEFRLLDSFLRREYLELVNYLEQTLIEISGGKHPGYYWVKTHTSVEADHFDAATVAANRAMRYYAGQESPARLKEWILGGFEEFCRVQKEFMRGLQDTE